MPTPREFADRIGAVDIELSKFEDGNELWAKRWELVTRVKVVFADGVTSYLAPDEFTALTKEQQDLVRNAPSGP